MNALKLDQDLFLSPEVIAVFDTSSLSNNQKQSNDMSGTSTDNANRKGRKRGAGKWSEGSCELPISFVPEKFDVICARGKDAWSHPGNRYFRAVVKATTQKYHQSTSRIDRTLIVNDILRGCLSGKVPCRPHVEHFQSSRGTQPWNGK